MGTYSAKPAEVEKKWVMVDADGLVVGRLATIVAMRLRGKHKPTYTPHVDDGDNVIVVNAAKVVLTGKKREQKIYLHHTGYIGGIKERSAKMILDGKFPERIVEKAIERMLPRGRSLFRPPGAAHADPAAAGRDQSQRPVRRHLHGVRRRPLRPGRRGAARTIEGAPRLRARPARRPQEGRVPDPRSARGRAQE